MKQIVVVCLAILFLCSVILGADQKINFSGTWKQDTGISDSSPKTKTKGGGGGVPNMPISIPGFGGGGMGGMGGGMGGMGGGMGGMGGGFGGGGMGMGGMGGGFGSPGGLISMAANTATGAIRGRNNSGGNPVPDYGIATPVGKTLVIEQTAKELKITNKETNASEDYVETFKLNGKDKIEMVDTEGGSKVKRVTKIKLEKTKLTLTTVTMLSGGNSTTRKREFTINKETGVLFIKNTASGKGFATQYQNLYYNKG